MTRMCAGCMAELNIVNWSLQGQVNMDKCESIYADTLYSRQKKYISRIFDLTGRNFQNSDRGSTRPVDISVEYIWRLHIW